MLGYIQETEVLRFIAITVNICIRQFQLFSVTAVSMSLSWGAAAAEVSTIILCYYTLFICVCGWMIKPGRHEKTKTFDLSAYSDSDMMDCSLY